MNYYYTAADFPLPMWLKASIFVVFWIAATLSLTVGLRGEGMKYSESIGTAIIGILGMTLPLWIQQAVAFAANRYQEWV